MEAKEQRELYDELRKRMTTIQEQLSLAFEAGDRPTEDRLGLIQHELQEQVDLVVNELRDFGPPYWTDEDEEDYQPNK
jgi:hypothetical protein